jgi:isochorismate hydrolase
MPAVRSPLRLDTDRSGLLVVDLQDNLLRVIPSARAVVDQTRRLIEAARILDVPVAATVQYPKGLGPLDPSLAEQLPNPEEKLDFSAAVCRQSLDSWTAAGRDQIIVVGVETHVCVQATVLDLLAEGLRVFVVAEAVASRHGIDHETAIDRMRESGAVVMTAEAVLFEWLSTADRPEFKTISRMVKEGQPRSGPRRRE